MKLGPFRNNHKDIILQATYELRVICRCNIFGWSCIYLVCMSIILFYYEIVMRKSGDEHATQMGCDSLPSVFL